MFADSQSQSAACAFGGKVGHEDFVSDVFRDSYAVVYHVDYRPILRRSQCYRYFGVRLRREGLQSVFEQVIEHLCDLLGVGGHYYTLLLSEVVDGYLADVSLEEVDDSEEFLSYVNRSDIRFRHLGKVREACCDMAQVVDLFDEQW